MFFSIQILVYYDIYWREPIYVYMTLENQDNSAAFGKDVAYRFLNSIYTNWRRFLFLLSSFTITNTIEELTDENRVNVLIVDDSFYDRMRSKSVELLSWVHDHAEKGKKNVKKVLGCLLWDGLMEIHLYL